MVVGYGNLALRSIMFTNIYLVVNPRHTNNHALTIKGYRPIPSTEQTAATQGVGIGLALG